MTSIRTVTRAVYVDQEDHGGGFVVRRPLAALGLDLDPFLMIDWFKLTQPYFAPHPHAGFSAVTWLLPSSPGAMRNRDTLGDDTTFGAGELHWFEAGHGAVHEETPAKLGVAAEGLQIFVNLPLREKHAKPRGIRVHQRDIPVVALGDSTARVVVGTLEGKTSPAKPLTPGVSLFDLDVKGKVSLPAPRSHTAFALVTKGEVVVNGAKGHAIVLEHDGDVMTLEGEGHVVVFLAPPLGEPVFAHGPFVMGSRADLLDAVQRYQSGKMGSLSPTYPKRSKP